MFQKNERRAVLLVNVFFECLYHHHTPKDIDEGTFDFIHGKKIDNLKFSDHQLVCLTMIA